MLFCMRFLLIIPLVALLLGGCYTTQAELREFPPVKTQEFAVPPDQLAYCVQVALEDTNYPSRTFPLRTNPTTHVVTVQTVQMIAINLPRYAMELRMTPIPSGVRVEGRQPELWGLLDEAWPIMEICVRQLIAAGSTPPAVVPKAAPPIVPTPR